MEPLFNVTSHLADTSCHVPRLEHRSELFVSRAKQLRLFIFDQSLRANYIYKANPIALKAMLNHR